MQTLFVVCLSAFVIAALVWFSTWAFWLHPPEGWLREEGGSAALENEHVRHARWFLALRVTTLVLGVITAALFAWRIIEHNRLSS